MNEFIYFTKLNSRLKKGPWLEEDEQLVSEHFQYLTELKSKGIVIMAGRTQVDDNKTKGIVLFYANSEKEAAQIMENDPAVKGGVMIAELAPFLTAIKGQWK